MQRRTQQESRVTRETTLRQVLGKGLEQLNAEMELIAKSPQHAKLAAALNMTPHS